MKALSVNPFQRPAFGFFESHDIDHFFDQFLSPRNAAKQEAQSFTPRTNIYEKDGSFTLIAELPGVSKEDIEVAIESGVLTIAAKKSVRTESEHGKNMRGEIISGLYQRQFNIDEQIDEKAISARYDNGVLTLELPKRQTAAPAKTQIAVNWIEQYATSHNRPQRNAARLWRLAGMNDDKHIELETKIAFLEQNINDLSDVLYEQQQALDALQQNFTQMAGKLRDNEAAQAPATDSKPPHY